MKNVSPTTLRKLQEEGCQVERVTLPNPQLLNGKKMIDAMVPSLRRPGELCVVISGDAGLMDSMGALVRFGCEVVLIHSGQTQKSFAEDNRWKSSTSWVEFLNMPTLKVDAKPCNHFNRNNCLLDKDCKFAHVCSTCGSFEHGSFACPTLGKTVPNCRFFGLGYCRHGVKCQHPHVCSGCPAKNKEHAKTCPIALAAAEIPQTRAEMANTRQHVRNKQCNKGPESANLSPPPTPPLI